MKQFVCVWQMCKTRHHSKSVNLNATLITQSVTSVLQLLPLLVCVCPLLSYLETQTPLFISLRRCAAQTKKQICAKEKYG